VVMLFARLVHYLVQMLQMLMFVNLVWWLISQLPAGGLTQNVLSKMLQSAQFLKIVNFVKQLNVYMLTVHVQHQNVLTRHKSIV
jgi:hypothetical protein